VATTMAGGRPSTAASAADTTSPVIKGVFISAHDVHAGQAVYGRVETTTNVPYVEVRIENMNKPLHRDGPGHFSLSFTIPWWLPWWLRHDWTLQIVARAQNGVETKDYYPISVH
jgi:hypothetical protein